MTIDPNERISRFVLSRREFRPSDQTVKAKAFVPPRNKRLSVYRTSKLSESAIWSIGNEFVAEPRGKTLYGRADLLSQDVYALQQKVEPETSIHPLHADIIPLHADIIPWPDGRDDILFLATQLALRSKFVSRTPSPNALGGAEK